MPPRSMFFKKHRPKGLEFPSCQKCNESTKNSDHLAAYLSRVELVHPDNEGMIDQVKYLSGIKNNDPELLKEMIPGPAGWQASVAHRVPIGKYALYVDGPRVAHHTSIFAAKFGFAMHYERTGLPVPKGGGVAARWFSNSEIIEGRLPPAMWKMFQNPKTLRQGRFNVEDQFQYDFISKGDNSVVMCLGRIRTSCAILAITCTSTDFFDEEMVKDLKIWKPGDFAE